MNKKVKTATALLLAFVMTCVSFASCSNKEIEYVVKNDVFNDDFFSDVASAELFSSVYFVNDNTDTLTGNEIEELKKLLSGLELEKTNKTLADRMGFISINLNKSDGNIIYILFSEHIITLSETENYYCEECIQAKLMKPFGFGYDDNEGIYLLSER